MSSHGRRVTVPSPRPPVREIQLINRTEEMQVLREAADRATSGQGGVVFLYGEAGIGKTRLARELGAYARSKGMLVLSGRCPALFRMDGASPYTLWSEVIRDYFKVCTPEQLYRVIGYYPAEICKLVPELEQKVRVIPKSLPIGPEHERNRLFEAVSQFITNISKEAPLLVILDDLQWTDQSSLLLMHYLARGVSSESLLILGAYRDTYVEKKHPLSPVLTELNRERLLQHVSLKRMSFDDVSEMIKRILEQDEVPMKFCELVYEKTRGNPFFVEEVIRSLKEEEIICFEKNKWKIKEISKIKFPKTVKDVIKKRISRLYDESQRVLTMASFVGKDFTFEALLGVTDVEENRLLEMVEGMLKTGLLKHTVIRGEDVFSFADIIVRDVVHEEVGPLKRKKLHGVVGHALEKVYSEKPDEHLGELALHFHESGDKDKALDYFLKAGEKAAKVYANSEAASYFQSALKLLEEKEDELEERGRVLERLGDIKKLLGEYEVCIQCWKRALVLWKQLHERANVSRLHRKMANVLWMAVGDKEKAKEHHNKALKILETKPESAELAGLYKDISDMLGSMGDMVESRSWAEKALKLAIKLEAHKVIADSYAVLGGVSYETGDKARGIEYLERALKIALDNEHMETALMMYNNLSVTLPAEEMERRLEYLEKGYELAKKMGDVPSQSWIGSNLALRYIGMGNMDKVVPMIEESVVLDRKAGNIIHLSLSLGALGYAYQILGDWKRSEEFYKEASTISEKLDDFQVIINIYESVGWFHFDKGQYAKAREYYEKTYEVCERHGLKPRQMWISQFLIWVHSELGDLEKAKNLVDNLDKFAIKAEKKDFIASADALKAMLFRAQKKWKESIEHFEKSLQKHEALNARRWNAYFFSKMILSEYARVYLERDQEGDRKKAYDLLNQALEIFQKMGAKKEIEKTKARIVQTGLQVVEPELVTEVALPERITSGYGDLDDLLFGGIPRNYAVILTSPSCDERDLLIKRFLEKGAKNGEVTFYVAIDPGEVKSLTDKSNFYLFICNPQADKIIKDMPNVFKMKGVENLTDINITLTSAFRKLDKSLRGSRRICVDVISDILLQHHAVQTRRWLTGFLTILKSRGFTTQAVMNPQMHSLQEVQSILGLFEGEINIYKKETEKGLEKFLKIEKMTNQKYSKSELLLEKEKLQT